MQTKLKRIFWQVALASLLLFTWLPRYAFAVQKSDTVSIAQRIPDPETIRHFRQHPDFQYNEVTEKSWVDKLLEWFADLFRIKAKVSSKVNLPDWAIYTLIGAIVLFAIYILLRSEIHGLFSRDKSVSDFAEVEGEHIHTINFNERITAAEREGNYRLAIRLHFLKVLQLLSLAELIHWKPHKTNSEYLYELRIAPLRAQFADSIRLYNSYWYGLFPLSKEKYDQSLASFEQFEMHLQREIRV